MNREEIMGILPHRDHMLLLDDAEELDGTAVGHYTVRGDEFFLKGHFPGNPIVPGVILCEILAQSACVLMRGAMGEGQLPVYTGLNNVKFRSPVRPGDTVEARCRIRRAKLMPVLIIAMNSLLSAILLVKKMTLMKTNSALNRFV